MIKFTYSNALNFLVFILAWIGCRNSAEKDLTSTLYQNDISEAVSAELIFQSSGTTVEARFPPPSGYFRKPLEESSFAYYLRNLHLKKEGSKVRLFNGNYKANSVHAAVVDLPIGNKNLHQCADAIMRLRAEHLWAQKKFSDIQFNFTNGFPVAYSEWRKGRRMVINGNKTHWNDGNISSESYESFWKYLELIFTYAGTLSLSKELNSVPISEIEIGDVFIQGGSPGHAIIVVDMVEQKASKEKMFLLAQSYMPAQEIHILKNPRLSPSHWYKIPKSKEFITPEWTFKTSDLKRFR